MSSALRELVFEALSRVIDPEVGVNIVDLGLVYGVFVTGTDVHVRMTMTTPACPLGEQVLAEAEASVRAVEGVGKVSVELVWKPAWSPALMTEAARAALGWGR